MTKQAAIAEFIEKNHLGYTVDSLNELQSVIQNTTEEKYSQILHNVDEISEKISDGYFFKTAIKKAIDLLTET